MFALPLLLFSLASFPRFYSFSTLLVTDDALYSGAFNATRICELATVNDSCSHSLPFIDYQIFPETYESNNIVKRDGTVIATTISDLIVNKGLIGNASVVDAPYWYGTKYNCNGWSSADMCGGGQVYSTSGVGTVSECSESNKILCLCTRDTLGPTRLPTLYPTLLPTQGPTVAPTHQPTTLPTIRPTHAPTPPTTRTPTTLPTSRPTLAPTPPTTKAPSFIPSTTPTLSPTPPTTKYPSWAPTPPTTHFPTVAPITISPLAVKTVAVAYTSSCALLYRGDIYCKGVPGGGQFDYPRTTHKSQILPLPLAEELYGGFYVYAAKLINGSYVFWGNFASSGETSNFFTPRPFPPLPGPIKQIAFTEYTLAVLLEDGSIWSLGSNVYNRMFGMDDYFGPGPVENVFTRAATTPADKIIGGFEAMFALLRDKTVVSWGTGNQGIRGDGLPFSGLFVEATMLPTRVAGLTNVMDIGGFAYNYCGLVANGSLYCWGTNGYGELGYGATGTSTSLPVHATVFQGMNIVGLLGAYESICAQLSNLSYACIGDLIDSGRMSDVAGPIVEPYHVPAYQGMTDQYSTVMAGVCGKFSAGVWKCFGTDGYGQFESGVTYTVTPIATVFPATSCVTYLTASKCAIMEGAFTPTCLLNNGINQAMILNYMPGSSYQMYCGSTYIAAVLTDNKTITVSYPDVSYESYMFDLPVVHVEPEDDLVLVQTSDGAYYQSDDHGVTFTPYATNIVILDRRTTVECVVYNTSRSAVNCTTYNGGVHWNHVFGATVSKISTGEEHACAQLADSTVGCFGSGTGYYASWVGTALDIAASKNATCVVDPAKYVWCVGDGTYGLLGPLISNVTNTWSKIPNIINAKKLTASKTLMCTERDEQDVWCWGAAEDLPTGIMPLHMNFSDPFDTSPPSASPVIAPTAE